MVQAQAAVGGRAWIQVTHQTWKVSLSLVLVVAGLAFFVLMVLAINDRRPIPALGQTGSMLIAMLCAVTGLLWLCLSVRCGSCRGFAAWHVIKTAGVTSWGYILLGTVACPICGHRPGSDAGAPNRREMSSRVV